MKMLIKVLGTLIAAAAGIFIGKGAVKLGDEFAEKHAPAPDENADIAAAAGGTPEPEAPEAEPTEEVTNTAEEGS